MSDRFREALTNAIKKAEERQWVYGILGRKNTDGTYTFTVPGRRGFVYVTIRTATGAQTVVPARNDFGVEQKPNLGVRMKLEHGVYVIWGKANRSDLVNTPATPPYGITPHATTHQHNGTDEIATATPAANAIPKADASGLLDTWVTPNLTEEQVQDFVGAMVSGNTETNITVTYDDPTGKLNFVVPAIPGQEEIEDFVAAQFTGNVGRVQFTYNDTTGAITAILDVSVADRYLYSTGADAWAEGTITAFARTLLDDADAATARATLGVLNADQETIEDFVGAMVSGNTETGIAVTYDDATGKLNFDAQTAGDARYVMLTTNQTVAGEKNFTNNVGISQSAPQVPLHVGEGTDVPAATLADIMGYFTRNGNTAIVVRNATNNVELIVAAGSTAGVFGTATNHDLRLRANNIDYVLVNAASGNVVVGGLTSTGASALGVRAGSSTNDAAVGGDLYVDSTSRVNSGTGETDLASYTVPANTLSANNMYLEVNAHIRFEGIAGTKTIKFHFGTDNFTVHATTGTGTDIRIFIRLYRTGAATQKVELFVATQAGNSISVNTFTRTLSSSNVLKFTGQATGGSNSITQHTMDVIYHDANT